MVEYTSTRPQGLFENYFVTRSTLDFYRSVCIWSELDRPITKPRLYAALSRLVTRHAALRAVVLDHDTKLPKFGFLARIELDKVVEFVTCESEIELGSLHETKFDYTAADVPLWKLVVMNMTTLAFVFDHSPLDGTSGGIFHTDLLEFINTAPESDLSVVECDSIDMFPAMESVVNTRPPATYIISTLWKEFGPKWKSGPPARNGSIYAIPTTYPVTNARYRVLTLSPSQATSALSQCRAHSTTLTAFLNAALLAAMTKAYPSAPGFGTSIPISARRFMPNKDRIMGAYVFQYAEITPAQAFSWAEAARFGAALKAGTTAKAGYLIGMLRMLFGNISGWMQAKVGQVRDRDMEISNLGAWKFVSGEYVAVKFGFSQPVGVTNPPVVISVAGIAGGSVTMVLGYSEDIVGDGIGDIIFNEFRRVVEEECTIPLR
ncbi:alcohol acetyltransferase-domain-containing protein [Lipomyces arxii]|uniref:alcohol acetyltransferase-domain-containing protein n=1 Tax=Lipomyces arxii TaxID=56418 RepID=UPI0034CDB2B2